MADFTKYSFNDLVKYCKENDIAYMGKNKKPYKDKTIIRNIMKKLLEKKVIINEVIEEKIDEEVKLLNEVVWTLEKTQDTNKEYKEIKDNLCKIVKKCHDLLYSSHAVVGIKAQNDIMKLLTLLILQPQFSNNDSELMVKCKKLLEDKEISKENYDKYMSYCLDLNVLKDSDNPLNEWKMLIGRFLSKILSSIYNEDDNRFNFNDEKIFMNLIKILCELNINSNFIDAFSTSFGDIHEAFRVYSGGKGSKELGQFFTPRNLIHSLFHGSGLNEIIKSYDNPTIYDCCMGTGGLLTRAYSNGNILPNNIYGCETEKDTIKFSECSLLLTTKVFNSNIIKCDSLCNNPYIFDIKYDIIFTNPPFGTKMNYDDLEKKFNNYKNLNYPDNIINFKDVYPIKSNNGACLFIQHCIYILKENGTCAIVLPDGEIFYGKTYLKLRKFMCENVNIIKIINVEGGVFEHTSIKTSIIIFQKNGSTKNIEFMEINKECNNIKKCAIININNIINKNYIFNYNNYIEKEKKINIKFENKKIKDLFIFNKGIIQATKCDESNIYKVISSSDIHSHSSYELDGENIFILNIFDGAANNTYTTKIKYYNGKCNFTNLLYNLQPIDKNIINIKYIYYYLNNNVDYISKTFQKGSCNKSLNLELFLEYEISLPPLDEQKNIVKKLDNLLKSIETIKLGFSQLKDDAKLFMEIYIENTDIEIKKLGDICDFEIGGTPLRSEDSYYNNGTNLWVSIRELNNNIIYDTKEKITDEGVKNSNVKLFKKGTILFSFKLSIGKMGIAGIPLYTNEAIAGINTKNEKIISNNYIYYYLLNKNFDEYGDGVFSKGSLNKSSIYDIEIPVPSLEIQEKIVKQLDIIYKKINDDYEYIKQLEDLSKIIISTTSVKSP